MTGSGGPTWDSYHEESRTVAGQIGNIEGRLASFATKEELADSRRALESKFYNVALAALFALMAMLGGIAGRLIQLALD